MCRGERHGWSIVNESLNMGCGPLGALDWLLAVQIRESARPVSHFLPVTSLSCRSCRPNAPFAELVQLSRTSIADEMREKHRREVFGE